MMFPEFREGTTWWSREKEVVLPHKLVFDTRPGGVIRNVLIVHTSIEHISFLYQCTSCAEVSRQSILPIRRT